MTAKQKNVLYRIIISAVLLAAIWIVSEFADMPWWLEGILYLIRYLKKSSKRNLKRSGFRRKFPYGYSNDWSHRIERIQGRRCRYAFLSGR